MNRHHRAAGVAVFLVLGGVFAPLTVPTASAVNAGEATIDLGAPFASGGVAVDESAHRAYFSDRSAGTVAVVDLTSNGVIATVPHGPSDIGDRPGEIAVDASARRAYVTNSGSSTVSVIDTSTNRVLAVIPHDASTGIGDGPVTVATNPGAATAYVGNYTSGSVSVVDTSTNRVVKVIPHDSATGIGTGVSDIAVDSELDRAFVVNQMDSTVSVIDTTTNAVVAVIPQGPLGIGFRPRQIAIDQAAHRAFVTNTLSSTVSVIDTSMNTVVAVLKLDVNDEPYAVTLDDVGGQIWVSSNNLGSTRQRITAIDTTTLRTTRFLADSAETHLGGSAQAIAVAAEARRAYAIDGTQYVSVLDLDVTAPLSRRSGTDRFASAAEMSASEFPSRVEVAYIASGENFPDALSATAAAGYRGGPVLLVGHDHIPSRTGAELARLQPKKIVVLGGTAAVSQDVERQLGSYAPISRLSGQDRFEVSAAISRDTFGANAPVAYIASGENFPDALSAGAIAGRNSGPVLLVRRDGIPDSVLAELARLKPKRIEVLGGQNAVGRSVADALTALAPTSRVSGADRFATSAALSAATFTARAGSAYIASGTTFPDALAGGPLAAATDSPVLLVQHDAIPAEIAAELRRLDPARIVVLGGTNAVSQSVYTQLRAILNE